MSKRNMLTDLARVSDVSVSTVDRVLKSRARVSESKMRRILSNARKLGYTQFDNVHTHDHLRVAVLIDESTRFPAYHIADGFNNANPFTASREICFTVYCCGKESIKQHLTDMILGTVMYNAVIIISAQDIEICSKLGQVSKKVPVLTMFSDLPSSHRQAYLGVDNRALGWALGEKLKGDLSLCSPEIYIVPGQINLISDEQQEMGFRSFVRKHLNGYYIRDMDNKDLNQILKDEGNSQFLGAIRDNVKIIFVTGCYLFSLIKSSQNHTPDEELSSGTHFAENIFNTNRYHASFSNTLNEIIERAMVLITFMDVGPRIQYSEYNYLPFNLEKLAIHPASYIT
ncbi:LacI family DNA-binding transcriptional regulator [Erwinia sp. S63]|uniref:LacI family DNA-binding transcriptional regulator n=1 Tax=Erwiniaceae TaxID=1903409 RepID=UPI001909238D|nr:MULTISPECIES: LacI family DNA-binding transcriptional regulator [Erwiniaceae]MBK0004632.1 LacI family DNA-binding transcriptional regulator [Erwinia sp. S38]MBK0099303.1 LacI family DNA-binding transcriptional regulator [Erwinia sp. S63]MBK0127293.1 LacI family DNA-binding transcriptional regulator [Pantoea sp. S61]